MITANLFSKRFRCRIQSRAADEGGMALVIAMVLLAMLAFLGSAALLTSSTEMDIAANERIYQMAFYGADGGAEFSVAVIRDVLNFDEDPGYPAEVEADADCLRAELLNFSGMLDDDGNDCSDISDDQRENPDIQLDLTDDLDVDIDVDRLGAAQMLPGGGVEFGAGHEGAGVGAATGGSVRYYLNSSQSQAPRNATSLIQSRYRYVIGMSGGS
jgi:Tfp pilus assembly protein PilX